MSGCLPTVAVLEQLSLALASTNALSTLDLGFSAAAALQAIKDPEYSEVLLRLSQSVNSSACVLTDLSLGELYPVTLQASNSDSLSSTEHMKFKVSVSRLDTLQGVLRNIEPRPLAPPLSSPSVDINTPATSTSPNSRLRESVPRRNAMIPLTPQALNGTPGVGATPVATSKNPPTGHGADGNNTDLKKTPTNYTADKQQEFMHEQSVRDFYYISTYVWYTLTLLSVSSEYFSGAVDGNPETDPAAPESTVLALFTSEPRSSERGA
jgi:hypothetical protein